MFLQFCLKHFNVYWLSTHCKGDSSRVIHYLSQYSADIEFLDLAGKIQPTNFTTFKVEALSGDFIWIDDQPTAYEIEWLAQNSVLNRWFQINTRKNNFELDDVTEFLKKVLSQKIDLS